MTQIASLIRRNQPHALALNGATYRQAGAVMRLLMSFLLAWPRTTGVVVRIGAVGLLFYGASFYTRDWRPVVAQAEQPAAVQATTRPKAEPRSLPSKLAELPAPVEPETTGSLTRITPAVPAPSAAETITPRPVPAPAGVQDRPAVPHSPKQVKPSKRTQFAARPAAVEEPSPVSRPPSVTETPIQFRLADRGGNN